MFGRKNVQETKAAVQDVRTVTGNRIVPMQESNPRSGLNYSTVLEIHKASFVCADDTVLELQVTKKQQAALRKGSHGTVRYREGKLIKFIAD